MIAAAVSDATVNAPAHSVLASPLNLSDIEGAFQGEESSIYLKRIGDATIVVAFDEQSSLGLVRLRVRNATAAIKSALAN